MMILKTRLTGILTLAICLGAVSTTRAGSYAYAEQTLTGLSLSLSGGTLSAGTVLYASSDGASLTAPDGSSLSSAHSAVGNGTDPTQAYVGNPAPPPGNTFTQFATFSSGPPQPSGSAPLTPGEAFSRGDALITPGTGIFTSGGVSASNVAETYMRGELHVAGSGTGTWSIAATFTVSGASSSGASLNYTTGYSNYLYTSLFNSPGYPGVSANANYSLDFTLKNSSGLLIGELNPGALNHSDSSPPNTSGLLLSGTDSGLIHSGLADGTYTLTITGIEVVQAAAVPEPSSIVLLGLAGVLGMGGLLVKKHRKR